MARKKDRSESVRELTESEQRRKEHYEKLLREEEEKGYHATELILDLSKVNRWAIFFGLAFFALATVIYWVTGHRMTDFAVWQIAAYFVCYLLLIGVHEGIHGLTWAVFAPSGFRGIEFGFIRKTMNPYATCSEPMSKGAYILGAVMPTILLGILPLIVCYILRGDHSLLFLLAATMVVSGIGDMAILWMILAHRTEGTEERYLDHPYEGGVVVLSK